MSRLRLTLACGDYDRTRPLFDGTIAPEGIELVCLRLPVEDIFFRMARFAEFDAAEMSLSSYLIGMTDDGPGRFVAIPAFLSRSFRHSGIYVNQSSGIDGPQDLVGRTVGLAEYQLTANVWIRGMLAEHHGVPVATVRYRTGGLHAPGRAEKLRVDLPAEIDIAPIPRGGTLSDMLAVGELDAVYSPRTPRCFRAGNPAVRRLFSDVRGTEIDYYRRTGIFPVMHVVVLRRDVYDAHRWAARSLFRAFVAARDAAWQGMDETASLRFMLPWLVTELEATRAVLGDDYWSYGVPGNEKALATLIGYSHAQGLARRAFAPAELFAPETLEDTVL
ncbi:MAG: ABC transporter substrate-binding protein [Deltaproteobacteria bacterium]|nr:MAG: ABC transporter substrate-binding protein [Deltaproteobacteria bacterium]